MKEESGTAPLRSAGADAPGPLYPPFSVHQHNDSRGWCVKDDRDQSVYPIVRHEKDEAAAHQIADALNAASSPSPDPAESSELKYRPLLKGETIQPTDEVWRGAGTDWERVQAGTEGLRYQIDSDHWPMRRPLHATSPDPAEAAPAGGELIQQIRLLLESDGGSGVSARRIVTEIKALLSKVPQ